MVNELLFFFGFIFFVTALSLPPVLGRHISEPKPKRDLTIHPNIWPLTLPEECFDHVGKKIRVVGFRVMWGAALCFLVVLLYIVFVLISN